MDLVASEPLASQSMDRDLYTVRVSGGVSDTVAVTGLQERLGQGLRIDLATRLENGTYQIELSDLICDLAGNPVTLTSQTFHVDQSAEMMIDPASQLVTVQAENRTVSVIWDQAAQQAVIATSPGPTIASRAYAMVHTAMFDAWSAYDPVAVSTQLSDTLQRPPAENVDSLKAEAMSHAAYAVLTDLFPSEVEQFRSVMSNLGFEIDRTSDDTSTPIGIGNVMADALIAARRNDGSNQSGESADGTPGVPYSNNTFYSSVNEPRNTTVIDRWTPEPVPIFAEPGTEHHVQQFLTPHWGQVSPFALTNLDQLRPPAPEPFLLVDGVVDLANATITLSGGASVAIDSSIVGSIINPAFIAQAEHVVQASANLTDKQKLIAEFWEDAKHTSFPPGTWMTFGQFVSGRDQHSLDDDAKLFFALSNAIFDASIATWDAKTHYDYVRPVRAIRDLGTLGLIGEFDETLGGYAIDAWSPGMGTQTILATDFLTYQTPGGDPSPPFSEYTSGHSSFSAAGATILELFTGDELFGGTVAFERGSSRFEPTSTPATEIELAWDTFRDAADEAGLSRIYGGIHFSDGDLNGRSLGNEVAEAVWRKSQEYITGSVSAP
ncbi:MAG: vanadium-dependent haloperoxidase [Pirellulaceae bacterium]